MTESTTTDLAATQARGSFPTADSTGVPAGTTLTDYAGPMTITQDGTVIDGARFPPDSRTLVIQAADVVIRNSRFETLGYHCVSLDDAYLGKASLRLEHCEFVGPWDQPGSGYDDLSCTVRGSNWSMFGCHIHGYGDGVHPDGNNVIEGNLLENFGWSETVGEHVDGSQSVGGTRSIHFIGNTIHVQLSRSVAGAIQFGTEYGGYDDVLVKGNLIAGGSWALYAGEDPNVDPPVHSTNVRVVDNVFSRAVFELAGANGICPYWHSAGEGNQWSGNTYDDGTEIPPPDYAPPEKPLLAAPTGYQVIFETQVPEITDNPDSGPVSLATRLVTSVDGRVGGVRLFAPDTVVGDGEVSLWDVDSATALATAPFTGADLAASDWNHLWFAGPVAVEAGRVLSVQVFWAADAPHYVATTGFFSTTVGDYVTNGPLSALDASGSGTHVNGAYLYAPAPGLATESFRATAYFVDVLFTAGSV